MVADDARHHGSASDRIICRPVSLDVAASGLAATRALLLSGYASPVTAAPDSPFAGSEGTLPVDFVPWQRGVTCTVRPAWLAPIDRSRTYLANVTVQRTVPLREPFTDYGSLYNHAVAIVRRHQLDRAGAATLHTWVQAHAWFRIDLPESALVSATVTLGLSASEDAATTAGELPPSDESLRRPSGHIPESLAARHEDPSGQRRVDHLYTDFDRTGSSSRDITLFVRRVLTRGAI